MTEEIKPSHEELLLKLFVTLAELEWHDVTADCPVEFDEPVTRVFITSPRTKLCQIWMLVRWADGEGTLSCLSTRHSGWRKSSAEKFQIEWLFEIVETAASGSPS